MPAAPPKEYVCGSRSRPSAVGGRRERKDDEHRTFDVDGDVEGEDGEKERVRPGVSCLFDPRGRRDKGRRRREAIGWGAGDEVPGLSGVHGPPGTTATGLDNAEDERGPGRADKKNEEGKEMGKLGRTRVLYSLGLGQDLCQAQEDILGTF